MAVMHYYYETLYLVRPDIKEEELSKIQNRLSDSLSSHEAELYKSDKWAQRNLAYEIQDHTKGVYYIIVYKALPGVVAELEKHLRFYKSDVLRFMTVKIDEDAANRARLAEDSKPEEKSAQEAPEQESDPSEPEEADSGSEDQTGDQEKEEGGSE